MRLQLTGINKHFGDKHVLKDVAFHAEQGKALGLLGRNGAGKSTTIRIIMGLFHPDSGTVTLDGAPIGTANAKIGYMPEERGLYPKKKIIDQMIFMGRLRGMAAKDAKESAAKLLEELEASEYLDKKLDTLSKGNQQKIQLAIAVINDPDVVILDEPFSGLDPVNAQLLKRMVERLVRDGKIVLFSSHQMAYVEEFCRHICIIKAGEIVVNGDLLDIKRSYPRDRVFLTPENLDADNVTPLRALSQGLLTDIEKRHNGLVCRMDSAESKNKFLSLLSENNFGFERFEIIEPTLEEIFVEKAGEQV